MVDFQEQSLIAKPLRKLPALPPQWTSLAAAVISAVKSNPKARVVSDTTRKDSLASLTREELLMQAAATARVLSATVGDAEHVGVIIPPSNGAVVANLAIILLGKVPVNLNYATKTRFINHAIEKCEITHVVAEPLLLTKHGLQPDAEVISPAQISSAIDDNVRAWVQSALQAAPDKMPEYFPGLNRKLTDPALVLFTTGSTGMPKGVIFSQLATLMTIMAISLHFRIGPNFLDGNGNKIVRKLLGSAPFFHVLGLIGTALAPLILEQEAVYHFNSIDARTICALVASEKVNIVLTTPTLMRIILQRATKEQFETVREGGHLVLGAEKLPPSLREQIKAKLGIEAEEGFGATEFTLISSNVNDFVVLDDGRKIWGNRPGTTGLPVPGVIIVIRDMKTGDILPPGKQGLVYAFGPQMTDGYVKDPEKTGQAIVNGWYYTGDVGIKDEDGFLKILFRYARFAKVGGEMVPMATVQETIQETAHVDDTHVHVTAIPDEKKGERVVVLYTTLGDTTLSELVSKLSDQLPTLWVPGERDFAQVESIVAPGSTGKLDLMELKATACALFGVVVQGS